MSALFERISIIGLGLIGSSIARAAREYNLADIIVGCDNNDTSLIYGRQHKFIDVPAGDPATAVQNSELVILSTPPNSFEAITRNMSASLADGALVMDTASVKRMTMQAIGSHLPTRVDFVPAHPIAGSERSGVSAGRADLFHKRRIIVTPDEPMMNESLQKITSFWKGMGARIEAMPPILHDTIYGYVSHLPHLLSFAARDILLEGEAGYDAMHGTFLRLGHSDTKLWSELFYLNEDNILAALSRYMDAISHVRSELQTIPDDAEQTPDRAQARNVLFPRIAASCLITTIMEAEKKAGVPFARYAGQGLSDFTSPASAAPDDHMEQISHNAGEVEQALAEYQNVLEHWHGMLASHQYADFNEAIKH